MDEKRMGRESRIKGGQKVRNEVGNEEGKRSGSLTEIGSGTDGRS